MKSPSCNENRIVSTGVQNGNGVYWNTLEDTFAASLGWENHIEECKGQCVNCHCNHGGGVCTCNPPCKEYDPDPDCHDNCYCDNGDDTILFGGWKKDNENLWGPKEPTKKSDFSAIYNQNENIIQVVKSSWVMDCHHCSPCYPGQGDIDTPGDSCLAYVLPPDFLSDDFLEENKKRMVQIRKGN